MLISPWLARWSRFGNSQSRLRRTRRRATLSMSARVAGLETRTLLASTLGVSAEAINTGTLSNFAVEAGDNRLLVVTVGDGDGTNTTAVTFNGQALTQGVERSDGFGSSEIWYLALGTSASATTANIVVTAANSPPVSIIHAVAFQGVDQSAPVTGGQTSAAQQPASALYVPSEPGDLVLDQFYAWDDGSPNGVTPLSGQAVVQSELNLAGGGVNNAFFTRLKAGEAATATETSWTSDDTGHIHVAVNINAVGEFRVNAYTTSSQPNGSVAVDADGDYVVVWQSDGQDGSGYGVYAQRYNAQGVAQGSEFRVNTYTAGKQGFPSVSLDADGDFVVAWHSDQDGSGYGVYAQRYNALGVAQGSEFRVNTYTADWQNFASVAVDADGDFVIVWSSSYQDGGDYGVYAQRYNALGIAQGSEFQVNTYTTGSQRNASVSLDADGDFVVAWQSYQDGDFEGIYGRRYNALGVAQGSEFQVNTYTTSFQRSASVALDADGDFVVAWQSDGQDGDGEGLYARLYQDLSDTAPPIVSDVLAAGQRVPPGGNILGTGTTSLTVAFSEAMNTAGGTGFANSVTNLANWTLTKNGVDISAQIAGITYSFNGATNKYEAVVTFTGPLDFGQYTLTALATLQDAAGNGLDGDQNGTAGGNFVRSFQVVIPETAGNEFRVNTYTTGNQAIDFFNSGGRTTAMDADGDFVVVWNSFGQDGNSRGVFAQRYNAQGVAQGSEFQVNSYTTGAQSTHAVAMDADGDFVIVWSALGQDGSGYGVYAQRYNALGVVQGSEFRVNTYTTATQGYLAVAADADGDFVIVWGSNGQDGGGYGIYGQRFDASGLAQGAEFRVNSYTTGSQNLPTVAMDADGDFVVGWVSSGQDGSNDGIYAQRYNAQGVAQGSEFRVNTYTTNTQGFASVALDADGDFVVAWASFGQDGSNNGIYAQRYNAQGVAQGSEFRVNTYTTYTQGFASVAMDADGDFVVTWASYQDGSFFGIYAQRYNALGVAQGTEFLVNTYTTSHQSDPSVAIDADGDFVVTWESYGQDGSSYGLYAQRYDVTADTAGPTVTDVLVNNSPLDDNARLVDGPTVITVVFSENLSTTGGTSGANSVTNPANWSLTKDGVGVNNLIQSITFGFNAATNKYEAVVTFTGALANGNYALTANGTSSIRDLAGNALDGDQNGTPGGNFVRSFRVAPQQVSGGEFRVNTYTTGNQLDQYFHAGRSVAMDADGDYVVVWDSLGQDNDASGVFAQRYNALGVAQGAEFQVNTYTAGTQSAHAVAMDADGDFVIIWSSQNQDGDGYGIYAQRYNALGVAQGSEFRVNTQTAGTQDFPVIAMDADGDFVIVWQSNVQDGSGYGVYAQRYNAQGVAQGAEFRVNTYTTNAQRLAAVGMDAVGGFVVTWFSDGQDGSLGGIYAQRYNAQGVAQGSEFQVNSSTNNAQISPAVALDADGDFVVTWLSYTQDGSGYGIYAQRYNAQGVAQGSEFRVNTYTTSGQTNASVAMDADGDFVVTWQSNGQDSDNYGVYAQRYNAAGVAQGGEFRVNTYTTDSQTNVSVAMDADGDFVVAWQSYGQDGSDNGIYAQRFFGRGPNIANQAFNIAENRPVGQNVGTVVANDPDAGQSVVNYAITAGNTGNVFAINAATGQITVASATLNFEGINQYNLTVQVTDNGTPALSSIATVTINITDLNEAPVFTAVGPFSVSENRSIGTFVGDVNAVDPEMQTLTYSIVGGDPNTQFAINANTGVITVNKATINFEATPQFVLQVKAQDNGSPSNFRTQNVTVNINNLNEAPVFVAPTTFSIAENRSVGYFVGDVNAVDPDAGQTLTYSITGGDPNAQFAINANTGVITVAKATINFEATPQFLLQVKAQDNGNPANFRTQTITVNITNLNEAPVFTAAGPFTIAENRSVNTFVGDVNAVDPDAGQTLTYSITGGDPNAQFAINANTGVITVAKATINFEATPQFILQVKAQDNGNPVNSRTQNVTVNITNLNESPVFVAPLTFTIPENRPNGTVVGTVTAVDPENQTLTYSITGGNTNNAFAINGATGQITVSNTAALDFETTPQFLLQIKAQDNGVPSNSKTQTVTINLTNIVGARVPTPRSSTRAFSQATATTPAYEQQAGTRSAPLPAAQKSPRADVDAFRFRLIDVPPERTEADDDLLP